MPTGSLRMRIRDEHFSQSLETVLRLKKLKFFYADPSPESGIFLALDPVSRTRTEKFGSGINIPDPQHCIREAFVRKLYIIRL
jgi:hypothetical protein